RPDAGQSVIRERAHAHAIDAARAADELDERVDGGVVLRVDVDADVGPGGQDVLEQGDLLLTPHSRRSDLGPRQVADGAGAVGQAVEGVVVEGDEDAVGGGVRIGLQVAVAERDGGLERLHGVLATGAVEVGALVREGQGAGPVEEGKASHGGGEGRGHSADEMVVAWPCAGAEIGRVPSCGATQVDRAVAAAKARLAEPLPAHERAVILDRAAILLAERPEDFAPPIAEEAAKPIRTARIEAGRAVDTFRFSAVEARSLTGEMVPVDASVPGTGKLAFTLRVPVGVVGPISPFNFPLNLVSHKVAPAIAAGCPVVLNPARQTTLSALALAEPLLYA